MLQKMAEIMEYHELLDNAAKCEVRRPLTTRMRALCDESCC